MVPRGMRPEPMPERPRNSRSKPKARAINSMEMRMRMDPGMMPPDGMMMGMGMMSPEPGMMRPDGMMLGPAERMMRGNGVPMMGSRSGGQGNMMGPMDGGGMMPDGSPAMFGFPPNRGRMMPQDCIDMPGMNSSGMGPLGMSSMGMESSGGMVDPSFGMQFQQFQQQQQLYSHGRSPQMSPGMQAMRNAMAGGGPSDMMMARQYDMVRPGFGQPGMGPNGMG